MKKILIIVNTVFLIFVVYFNLLSNHRLVFAQQITTIPIPTITLENPLNLLKDLLNFLFSFSISFNPSSSTAPATIIPSSAFSLTPTLSPDQTITLASLRDLFQEIENKMQVPSRILEAVLIIESPDIFYLSNDQINQYSQPGNVIPGCGPNVCSATGPMQMTIGIDNLGSPTCSLCCVVYCLTSCPNAWSGYGNSVNNYNSPSHSPNACNLRDNIYAAALKLKTDSGATGIPWTQEQVYQAATRYYGSCSDNLRYARLGNRTYCEFVWWYYTL